MRHEPANVEKKRPAVVIDIHADGFIQARNVGDAEIVIVERLAVPAQGEAMAEELAELWLPKRLRHLMLPIHVRKSHLMRPITPADYLARQTALDLLQTFRDIKQTPRLTIRTEAVCKTTLPF